VPTGLLQKHDGPAPPARTQRGETGACHGVDCCPGSTGSMLARCAGRREVQAVVSLAFVWHIDH
jgi:hypothetical protein